MSDWLTQFGPLLFPDHRGCRTDSEPPLCLFCTSIRFRGRRWKCKYEFLNFIRFSWKFDWSRIILGSRELWKHFEGESVISGFWQLVYILIIFHSIFCLIPVGGHTHAHMHARRIRHFLNKPWVADLAVTSRCFDHLTVTDAQFNLLLIVVIVFLRVQLDLRCGSSLLLPP